MGMRPLCIIRCMNARLLGIATILLLVACQQDASPIVTSSTDAISAVRSYLGHSARSIATECSRRPAHVRCDEEMRQYYDLLSTTIQTGLKGRFTARPFEEEIREIYGLPPGHPPSTTSNERWQRFAEVSKEDSWSVTLKYRPSKGFPEQVEFFRVYQEMSCLTDVTKKLCETQQPLVVRCAERISHSDFRPRPMRSHKGGCF